MRFVQGIDYGPRKGTLGFVIHMAEGGDGTLGYLARRDGESLDHWKSRVRGVSANFVILSTGEVVQMVAWDNASGSMNPLHRGDDVGFYQTKYIKAVLGAHYVDPNAYSVSVEVTGYRSAGPTREQVESLVALIAAARRRYPGMVGAFGHADQTDTKGCPGVSANMLEVWARVGHGVFQNEGAMPGFDILYDDDAKTRFVTATVRVKDDGNGGTPHSYLRLRDNQLIRATGLVGKDKPAIKVRLQQQITPNGDDSEARHVGWLMGTDGAVLLDTDVTTTPWPSEAATYSVSVGGKPAGSVTLP